MSTNLSTTVDDVMDVQQFIDSVPANKTPIPNVFYDHIYAHMSDPETAIMFYLFRHAWRNHASTAAVTYRQFITGTLGIDGRVIDYGCGIKSIASIAKGIALLEKRGLITCHRRAYQDNGNAPTIYELHVGLYGEILRPRLDVVPLGPAPARPKPVRFEGKRAWEAIKRAHDYRCADCGLREPDIQLTRDHIVPTSKGGSNVASNIAPRCRSCNSRKGARVAL